MYIPVANSLKPQKDTSTLTAAYGSRFGPISRHSPAPLGSPAASPSSCTPALPSLILNTGLHCCGDTAATIVHTDSQAPPASALSPGTGLHHRAYLKLALPAVHLHSNSQTHVTSLHCSKYLTYDPSHRGHANNQHIRAASASFVGSDSHHCVSATIPCYYLGTSSWPPALSVYTLWAYLEVKVNPHGTHQRPHSCQWCGLQQW